MKKTRKKKILFLTFLLVMAVLIILFLLIPEGIDYVRGMNYVLTYPGKIHYSQVPEDIIEKDFKMMSDIGVNTIRTYDVVPDFILDLAEKYEIGVIETVALPGGWTAYDSPFQLGSLKRQAVKNVLKHRDRKCIVAWSIWNDAPFIYGNERGNVITRYGEKKVNAFLEEIYKAVKKVDPYRPVTGSNMVRDEKGTEIGVGFLDFMSFNTYVGLKDWNGTFDAGLAKKMVDEVGIFSGKYGKPVLISELGYSTYWESMAGHKQRDVLAQQMKAVDNKLLGFLVFEWADDWKKDGNYNKLDEGIEENWGIVDGYRNPKDGYEAVKKFYRKNPVLSWLIRFKKRLLDRRERINFYQIHQKFRIDKSIYKKDAEAKWDYIEYLAKENDWISYYNVKDRLFNDIIKETNKDSNKSPVSESTVKAQYLNWMVHTELMDGYQRSALNRLGKMLLEFAGNSRSPEILKEYAFLLYERGEPGVSKRLFGSYAVKVVEECSPEESIRKLKELGNTLLEQNKLEEANVVLAQSQKLALGKFDPDKACRFLIEMASIYKKNGYPQKAISVLCTVIETYPESSQLDDAIYRLAGIYQERKQLVKAEEEYKKLVFDYPKSPLAGNSITSIISIYAQYSLSVKIKKMVPFLEKVIQVYKDETLVMRVLYELASIYEVQKDYDKAILQYEKIIELYPGSNYAGYAERDLSRLLKNKQEKGEDN